MTYDIDLLVTDFDKTLVKEDSTYFLIEQTISALPEEKVSNYVETLELLGALYAQEYLESIYYSSSLDEVISSFCRLEEKYSSKANQLMVALTQEEVYKIGENLHPQEGSIELIRQLKSQNIPIYINSLNWNEDIIYGSQKHFDSFNDIFANKVTYENGIACGEMELNNINMETKAAIFFQLKENHQANKTAYVGDDVADLLCLIEADFGFALNPSKDLSYLLRTYNLEDKVIVVHNWEEIKDIMASKNMI